MTGCGTKARRASGSPAILVTDCTTLSNLSVWIATVGTPYLVSSVMAWVATPGAQVLQWPTPTIAASPLRLDLVPGLGIVVLIGRRERDDLRLDARHVLGEPGLHLLEQLDRIVEPAIDQIDRLAVEALEPRRRRLPGDLRRIADRIENGDLLLGGVEHFHGGEVSRRVAILFILRSCRGRLRVAIRAKYRATRFASIGVRPK